MSMTDYEQAYQLIQQYPQIIPYMWDCSEADIRQVEHALGVTFPPTYRRFVRECGALDYYAIDIQGVIPETMDDIGLPNVLVTTQSYREDAGLPLYLIVVEHPGSDYLYCLNTRQRNASGEYPVVVYYHWCTEESQPYEVIANDYGAYMFKRLEWAIGRWMKLPNMEKDKLRVSREEGKGEDNAR